MEEPHSHSEEDLQFIIKLATAVVDEVRHVQESGLFTAQVQGESVCPGCAFKAVLSGTVNAFAHFVMAHVESEATRQAIAIEFKALLDQHIPPPTRN